ncbi:nitroreductase [Aliiroseovarius sp. S2029]|uniref:nitroreductase n=1 Tax=Aliiroseovarius sp. S2029 TaxID=2936988 RepID=UPI0020C0989A|nr:nitroreductase [Aliiroseovarius sp. S2029]MCK8483686.1 nitroreductase [Aliiroseovarius sp. S2029]
MTGSLEDLLRARRSVRAFTQTPVPRDAVQRMCRAARSAPSGANLQPGQFLVLTGSALRGLVDALQDAVRAGIPHAAEYSYFPSPMPEMLKARQRAAGYALYTALGIGRRDVEARRAQFARNYAFFGAPVGVVVTIRRDMGKGCFMDLGMSLMAFLLSAEDQGFGATGIGALANYGPLVHDHLNLPDEEMVVCGIAVGVADTSAPENQFRTARAELQDYASFRGFDDPA